MKKQISLVTIMLILLTGCGSNNEVETVEQTQVEDTTSETTTKAQTTNETSEENIKIVFGDTITTTATTGVTITGSQIVINVGGTYELSGVSSDANILIQAPEDEDVVLLLNNVNLTSNQTAPIYIETGDSLTLESVDGTTNTFTDSTSNQTLQAPISSDEARVYFEGDTGIININSNSQEGVESNDEIFINGGVINIESPDDGLQAGDGLVVNGGTLNVDAGGDGLDSNDYMEINGGDVVVSAGNNGNGPIDYGEGNTFNITGGSVIAVGGTMGVTPDSTSTQNAAGINVALNTGSYELVDSTGNVIKNFSISKDGSYVFITDPNLTIGETYILTQDGSEVTSFTLDSYYYTNGNSGPGGF